MATDGNNVRCRVNVVGANAGGIAAAIALRKAGHEVHIYESGNTSGPVDSVVHIGPNANSVLHQLGVDHESAGGSQLELVSYYNANKGLIGTIDVKLDSRRWQKPWLVTRYGDLVNNLDIVSRSRELPGLPVEYHRGSVPTTDPQSGTIKLSDGTSVTGDIVINAEKLYSNAQGALEKEEQRLSQLSVSTPYEATSGLEPAGTFLGRPNEAGVFISAEGGFLVSSTTNASSVYHARNPSGKTEGRGILDSFKTYCSPSVLVAVENASKERIAARSPENVHKNFQYSQDCVAFVGDAAHAFPTQSMHGVSMAIEDGASLGVFLSGLGRKEDIAERLRLYGATRQQRVSQLQVLADKAETCLLEGDLNNDDIEFASGHDEIHHSTQVLRQYIWDRTARISWRQPVGFGPMTSPRQHQSGELCANPRPERLADATSQMASIRFRTSATLLRNLFPSDAYSFIKNDTVAEASFVFQSIENLAWLGGGGYNLALFQIHGIRHHSKATNTTREGSYVAVVLEDLTDPILSGREDLGWPKLYSEIEATDNIESGGDFVVRMLWRGAEWLSLSWDGIKPFAQEPAAAPAQGSGEHVFVHKYIPATVVTPTRKAADADYDVLMPSASPVSKPVEWQHVATKASIHVPTPDERCLPTLWHIASRLAELPVFDIVDAKIGMKQGQDDFTGAVRV